MNSLDFFNARLEATISPMDYFKSSKDHPEKYFLIDVRNGPSEVRSLTIKGAQAIPEHDLPNRLEDIPKDKEIIVYCWDVWCNTASKAAKFLLEKGYQVKELTGGIAAWREMNFPVSACTEGDTDKDACGC
ncbi:MULTISPECIES: rhodanese-like domain-containing protein [Bacillus]|uniref:rhodanese-like domain-containing protein n=1 Tax=Bacillus TaxID=1386 RepID=UPI002243967F|nr:MULTISPECIES: rhodanese-like domain-containing protein [Bacillus]MDN5386997.1 rhodanese-like domain-containing protein [Bacillus sp. LB7]MEC1020967.1 rhodanese-like domain-containing protein [Bacillus paralicheniformis]MEC1026286.1 rhodanese-like domain-containing protein [Bacillus paralicheniformis]MEC1033442.1 rhodanese-like domain-containing protein [Bacillus paralicheniformis]MEC1051168.1 rhodanese-like domain-containing protein [Bacillus paralicheniformis]